MSEHDLHYSTAFSSGSQTIESFFMNLPALNGLIKCKVTMLQVTYQGVNGTKQRRIHDKSKTA